jgi:hypothetical protein
MLFNSRTLFNIPLSISSCFIAYSLHICLCHFKYFNFYTYSLDTRLDILLRTLNRFYTFIILPLIGSVFLKQLFIT